jgi:hypothetical protein
VHEPLLGSEARLLGKGEPPLLRQHADVAELLHVVRTRQTSYHPLGTEPLQGLEVKVPEALVPLPRLIVPTSSKTDGLCYLHVEDVELIDVSSYLGKKETMAIPNSHDSIHDLHTRTILIQLSQADDRVSQRRDVIDLMSNLCSPDSTTKMTEPTPLISTPEASPNLMEPRTSESSSMKNFRRPVM